MAVVVFLKVGNLNLNFGPDLNVSSQVLFLKIKHLKDLRNTCNMLLN